MSVSVDFVMVDKIDSVDDGISDNKATFAEDRVPKISNQQFDTPS